MKKDSPFYRLAQSALILSVHECNNDAIGMAFVKH